MVKILLNGANGRMGKEVIKKIDETDVCQIVCGFDMVENDENGFPIYNKYENIKETSDVIIDFSVPVATMQILKYAKDKKIPIVIATTGFSEEQLEEIKTVSNEIPVFISSNMSLDINLMVDLVQKVAKVLNDTDIEIVETHHNRKVDSPSGTAILLANAINDVLENKKKYEFDRMQKREKRSKDEIGFSSIRGGNIVGEHIVKFFGESETLEIKHTAYSRQVFVEGAIKAAMFIVNKKTGMYNMKSLVDGEKN
ncbi:MAG: 4-hydroxy-tetrahydrodipicolinate reductase [Clostridia bacterium]|nr:4-hydroxy-tetrahydrodipicolinate reductase [Clostridia bacterium]